MNTVVCEQNDLIPNAGVCALIDNQQVAIFYLPEQSDSLFAIDNFDPFSKANVLSRGIIGSFDERIVVASPLLKQHFDLKTGQCMEDETVTVKTWPLKLVNGQVILAD